MQFYKVINENSEGKTNQNLINPKTKWIFIHNELYTKNEIKKLNLKDSFIKKHFNLVNISKFNTHWFFGARWQNN